MYAYSSSRLISREIALLRVGDEKGFVQPQLAVLLDVFSTEKPRFSCWQKKAFVRIRVLSKVVPRLFFNFSRPEEWVSQTLSMSSRICARHDVNRK